MALKDRAIRLLRAKWPSATMLSEELYAILSQEDPTAAAGVGELTPPAAGEALFDLPDFSDGDVIIRFPPKNGQPPLEIKFSDLEDALDPDRPSSASVEVIAGVVVSKIDASHYVVRAATGSDTYDALCIPTLPADEEIPADPPVEVLLILVTGDDGTVTATFQVPTWL